MRINDFDPDQTTEYQTLAYGGLIQTLFPAGSYTLASNRRIIAIYGSSCYSHQLALVGFTHNVLKARYGHLQEYRLANCAALYVDFYQLRRNSEHLLMQNGFPIKKFTMKKPIR